MSPRFIKITNANADAALCSSCGGKCCQHLPGSVLPWDLADEAAEVEARVKELLATGRYALDAHEDWGEAGSSALEPEKQYFLRPAVQGYEGRVLDESWGGACTFHSETGCELSELDRPGECKLLVPAPDKKCGYPEGWSGRASAARAWAAHRDFLETLLP